jgi:hypothetical protein
MGIVKAPFASEQVEALNRYQKDGMFHQFTCCSDENSPNCKRRGSYETREQKAKGFLDKGLDWLKEEVKKLGDQDWQGEDLLDWQMANILASREIPYSDGNDGVLIATLNGWVCPCGEYRQDWAHDFMANPLKTKSHTENPGENE